MSLKAKIEAVIYTSEEPITLAQLAGLLGEEAQAELDALNTQQLELSESSDDADALNAEVMDTSEVATPTVETLGAPGLASETWEGAATVSATTTETLSPPEPDEKKLAREQSRRLRDYLRSLLDQLIADYASSDRGLEIREVAGGYRLATKPE